MKKNKHIRTQSLLGVKLPDKVMPAEKKFNSAVSLFQNGRSSDAKILLKEVLSINSKHAESWFFFALIADEELLPQDAINYLGIALKIDPNNLKYIYTLGDIYYANEYLKEGVELFESIIIKI
jgi:tetratricopeptide (TPR) repeat protein